MNLWVFADVGSTLKAFLVFSFFMTAPGYVAGWLSDACGFRKGSALRQAAFTVPLSISVAPILIYVPWRFLSIRAVWAVMAAVGAAFLVILAMELRDASYRPGAFRWQRRAAWIIGLSAVALWMLIGLGSLLDLRIGNRLYRSVTVYDYLSRIPIANSISHQEKLPAVTPFLTLRQPVQLRYHYFWPMVCGLVAAAGQGAFNARDATIAGALWSGIALICLIPVYQRIFQRLDPARWRPYAIGLGLLGVTGLDLLPVLRTEQVTGWLDAMLWVPHHMAALAACLIAFLLLWRESQRFEGSPRAWPRASTVILSAVALASAAGMSVFVTFTFACILVVWALLMLIRSRWMPLAIVAAAGTVSLFMALPFIYEMRASAPVVSPRLYGVHWQVRRFYLMSYRGELESLELATPEQSFTSTFFRLVFLPLNYLLQLGIYFYAGIYCCRRLWRNRPISSRDLAAVAMLGTSVIICTFLASSVAEGVNDLGWRGFAAAQFILLLWTTELLDERIPESPAPLIRPPQHGALILLLVVGAFGTLLDLTELRGFDPFIDSHLFGRLGGLPNINLRQGERSAVRADSYAWIRSHTPANAVVEANPDQRPYFYGLYAERAGLALGRECEVYSGRARECFATKAAVRPLFSGLGSLDDFPNVCRAFPLDIVIVTDSDAVWPMKDSWIQHFQPVYSTEFTKVFACRPSSLGPSHEARGPRSGPK